MLVNLKFHRVDYAQIGTSSRGCMRIIRNADKEPLGTPKSAKRGEKKPKYKVCFLNHLKVFKLTDVVNN